MSIVGQNGEVLCESTLGARGAGTIAHRKGIGAGGAARFLTFPVEDPFLRQLRAFARRCATPAEGRIDAHAITNLELLHHITPS